MAKKDIRVVDTTVEDSPYMNKTREEMIELLEKKDDTIDSYSTEILKLRKQIEECGEKYDEALEKSKEVVRRSNEMEADFNDKLEDLKATHKAELDGQEAAVQMKMDDQKKALEKDFQKELALIEKKHASEVKALNAEIKRLEALSTEGVFSEKLRKRFLDASKKAINETFDKLAEEAEAEVSDKKKVEEAVNKANNRLKWLKEQQDHNAAETEELMSLLKELTGGAEA